MEKRTVKHDYFLQFTSEVSSNVWPVFLCVLLVRPGIVLFLKKEIKNRQKPTTIPMRKKNHRIAVPDGAVIVIW